MLLVRDAVHQASHFWPEFSHRLSARWAREMALRFMRDVLVILWIATTFATFHNSGHDFCTIHFWNSTANGLVNRSVHLTGIKGFVICMHKESWLSLWWQFRKRHVKFVEGRDVIVSCKPLKLLTAVPTGFTYHWVTNQFGLQVFLPACDSLFLLSFHSWVGSSTELIFSLCRVMFVVDPSPALVLLLLCSEDQKKVDSFTWPLSFLDVLKLDDDASELWFGHLHFHPECSILFHLRHHEGHDRRFCPTAILCL